jgi:hypothetical protein
MCRGGTKMRQSHETKQNLTECINVLYNKQLMKGDLL